MCLYTSRRQHLLSSLGYVFSDDTAVAPSFPFLTLYLCNNAEASSSALHFVLTPATLQRL